MPFTWKYPQAGIRSTVNFWTDYWGDLYFEAADVAAAPDLDGFLSRYDSPGIRFSASEDWGAIGGYVQLLDGVKYWYEDSLHLGMAGRPMRIQVYEGAYDYWDCGRDADVIVIGVRPIVLLQPIWSWSRSR